jgi:hypothetical protein
MDQLIKKEGDRIFLNLDVTEILEDSERSTNRTFGDESPEFISHASKADCINRIVDEVLIPLRDSLDQKAGSIFLDIQGQNTRVIN